MLDFVAICFVVLFSVSYHFVLSVYVYSDMSVQALYTVLFYLDVAPILNARL